MSFCYYLLLPANRSPGGISQILSVTDGQPSWIAAIMNSLSGLAGQRGLEISIGLAVLCGLAAAGVFSARLTRPALIVAGALGLLFWLGEGLGGVFTGQGTDPNTGPLLIFLAVCYWPRPRRDARPPAVAAASGSARAASTTAEAEALAS